MKRIRVILAVGLAPVAWLACGSVPAADCRPNFVIILADQQSPHVLGCAGDRVVRTPHLDRLAAGGVRFTATYCGSPLCVPSRMTFLTARHCSQIGVWSNGCLLDSETPTFPGALAAAGYETVLAGRMHFAGPDQRHGFTRRTIGDVGQPRLAGEGKPSLLGSIPRATAGQSKEAVETAGPGRTSYMAYDDAVTESACKFLAERDRQSADKPFALVVGYVLPHCPYICPPELFHYYYPRVSLPQLPVGYLDKMHSAEREDRRRRGFDGLSDVQVRTARAAYYGLVEYHDRLCGRVFDALRRTRFAENTVVVYTSDHGDMAGEHRLWTKSVLYEASVGVPMIWAWPGRFRAGSVVGRVTSLLDIGPTLLELAGAPPMKNVAGRSLSGFLRGGGDVQGWPDDALAECCGYQADQLSRMLREGPWKIIVHHGHDMPQLFNLAEDPQEMRDRSDDPACADVRQRLLRRVREGWDPESIGKSLAQSAERRRATWEKAKAHATPTADYWDMPPDANVFPLNGQAVDDGTVVRDVWAGHFELLKARIEKSREAIAASLRQPGARPVTVAVWQMRNHCGGQAGKRENLRRMLTAIEHAGREGAQILALPEMCLPGYFTQSAGTPAEATRANHELADRPGQSEFIQRLRGAARDKKMVLAFGFCEREGERYYNAIGVIDADGAWLGTRRKNPLSPGPYDLESFTQPPPDRRSAVFRTRYAIVGISNCFDGEFPESIRRMRLAGAELLLWCNAATGNVVLGSSNRIHHAASYAQANQMWVACCNAVGKECYGTSVIVGPRGEPLVVLPTDREVFGVTTINLSLGAIWDNWRLRLDPQLLAPGSCAGNNGR